MRSADSGLNRASADPRWSENPQSAIHNPQFHLLEGADNNKDQSYFLALLSPDQLRDARFPIGDLPKPELRRLAREAGLVTAEKKDSQGICFIGEVKMQDFLRQYVPDEPGPIIRAGDGRVLGEHRGLHYYTLGQRRGIRVPSNTDHRAYVVVGKRADDRALLVAFDSADAPGLFQTEVQVHGLQWNSDPPTTPCTLEGRVRYRDPRVGLEFIPDPAIPGSALIRFHAPQRALASGQILALHQGERLLGGGIYC
jgi:tRNA-specific 2-thiouridylase